MTTGSSPTAIGPNGDPVLGAVRELTAAIRENMRTWIEVLEHTEALLAAGSPTTSWSELARSTARPPVVLMVAQNQERLTQVAARFRRTVAHALLSEGMPQAEIAQLFGVTRQRIGYILSESDPARENYQPELLTPQAGLAADRAQTPAGTPPFALS